MQLHYPMQLHCSLALARLAGELAVLEQLAGALALQRKKKPQKRLKELGLAAAIWKAVGTLGTADEEPTRRVPWPARRPAWPG